MARPAWLKKLRASLLGKSRTQPIRRLRSERLGSGFDQLEDRVVPDATETFGPFTLKAIGTSARFETNYEQNYNLQPALYNSFRASQLTVLSSTSPIEVYAKGAPDQKVLFVLPEGGRFRAAYSSFGSPAQFSYADIVPRYGLLTVPNGLTASSTVAQQQTLDLKGIGGSTFKITYNGFSTANLPITANASQVQSAIANLPGIGNAGGLVDVVKRETTSFDSSFYTVTFGGTLYSQPSLLQVSSGSRLFNGVVSPVTMTALTKRDTSLAATNSNGNNSIVIPLVYREKASASYLSDQDKAFEMFRDYVKLSSSGLGIINDSFTSNLTIPASQAAAFPTISSPAFSTTFLNFVPDQTASTYSGYPQDTNWQTRLFGKLEFPSSFVGAVDVSGTNYLQATSKGFKLVADANVTLPMVSAGIDALGKPRPVTFPFAGMNFSLLANEAIGLKYNSSTNNLEITGIRHPISGLNQYGFKAKANFDGGELSVLFQNLAINTDTGNTTLEYADMVLISLGGLQFFRITPDDSSYDSVTKRFKFITTNFMAGEVWPRFINNKGELTFDNFSPVRVDPIKITLGAGNISITNGVLDPITNLPVQKVEVGRADTTRKIGGVKWTTYNSSNGTTPTMFLSFLKSNVYDAANALVYAGGSYRIYGKANTTLNVSNVTLPSTVDLGTAVAPTGSVRPGIIVTNGEVERISFPVNSVTAGNLTFTNPSPGFLGYLTADYVPPLAVADAPSYLLTGRATMKAVGALTSDPLASFGQNGSEGLRLFTTQNRFTMSFGLVGAIEAGNNSLFAYREAGSLLATYNPTTRLTTISGRADVTFNGSKLKTTATIPSTFTGTGNNAINGNWTLFLTNPLSFNGFSLVPQATGTPLRLQMSNTATSLLGNFSLSLEGQDLYGGVRSVNLAKGNLPASGMTLEWTPVGTAAPPWALGGVLLSGMQSATLTDTLTIPFTTASFEGVNLANGLPGSEPVFMTAKNGKGVSTVITNKTPQQVGDVNFSSFVATFNFATTPRKWEFVGNGTALGKTIAANTAANGTGSGKVNVSIGGDALTGYQLAVAGVPKDPIPVALPLPNIVTFNGIEFDITNFKAKFKQVTVTPTQVTYNIADTTKPLEITVNVGRTSFTFSITEFLITVTSAGAVAGSFKATVKQNTTFVIGNASFKVNSITVGYNSKTDTSVPEALRGALQFTGSATITYKAAGVNVDMTVEFGDAAKPGLVIKDGAVQSLKVAVSGSFTLMKLTATVDPAQALTLQYDRADQEYILYGAMKLSTASQSGVRVIENLSVSLGTEDAPGLVIASGTVETVDIIFNTTSTINIFSLKAAPKDLRLKYTAATNQLAITGGVEITLASGLVLKAGLPGQGLLIDTSTGKVQIKGVSLASDGDIKFGTAFTIKNLEVTYADDGTNVSISAGATLVMPSGLTVGGSFQLKDGKLNAISITFSKNPGILVAGGLVNIYSISGSVKNLQDLNNFEISATVKATVGPAVVFAGETYALADLSGTITVTKSTLTLDGSVDLVGGLFGKGTMNATLDWGSDPAKVTFNAEVKLYPGDIIRGHMSAYIDLAGNVDFNASIGAYVPDKIPIAGGESLGKLTIGLRIRPSLAPSESFVSFDIQILNVGGGIKAAFDGAVDYNLQADFGIFKARKTGRFNLRDALQLPTVHIVSATAIPGTPNGLITLSGTTIYPAGTTIDVYADTDAAGDDGLLIATVPYQSGNIAVTWEDMAAFAPPGKNVHVYAVINDGNNPEGFSDYSSAFSTDSGFLPGVTVPTTQTFEHDRGDSFDTANGTAITIADPRLATSPNSMMQVTLNVGRGTLVLPDSLADVMVTGDGTDRVILIGTATQITTALDGLTYRPDSNTVHDEELSVSATFLPLLNLAGEVTRTIPLTLQPFSLTLEASEYTGGFSPTRIIRNATGVTPLEDLLLTDAPSGFFSGATVAIANYKPGFEYLAFSVDDQLATGLHENFDPATGVLTLTGFGTRETYMDALHRITFFTEDTASSKSLLVTVASGHSQHASLRVDLSIVDGIAPPSVSISPRGFNYVQGDAATLLAPSGTITVPTGAMVTSMTIALAPESYVPGEDVLAYTGSTIPASFDSVTGVLTFTGTFDAATYSQALQQVTYFNANGTVTEGIRDVLVTVTDDATENTTGSTLVAIGVSAVATTYTGPVLSLAASTTILPANEIFTRLDPDLTLTSDVPTLTNVAVAITSGYVLGEDELLFTDLPSNLNAKFDPVTGTLHITGAAPVAEYEAVLRGVLIASMTSDRSSARTITVTLTASANLGSDATDSLDVSFPAAPYLDDGIDAEVFYTHGREETAIVPDIIARYSDTLTGATVAITSNYHADEDELHFTDQAGITGSFDANTGFLTLTGTASVSAYQTALASVRYDNTRFNPVAGDRTVAFQLQDGTTLGNVVKVDVSVDPVVVGPTLAVGSSPATFTENGSPRAIASALTLTAADATDLDLAAPQVLLGAEVDIENYVPNEDRLTFTDQNGITGEWDAENGRMILTGTASYADYQAALRSVTYENLSEAPITTPRTITFHLLDDPSAGLTNKASITMNIQSADDLPTKTGTTPSLSTLVDSMAKSLGLDALQFAQAATVTNAVGSQLVFTPTSLPSESLGEILLSDGSAVLVGQSYPVTSLASLRFLPTLGGAGVGSFDFRVALADGVTGTLDSTGMPISVTLNVVGVTTTTASEEYVAQLYRDLLGTNANIATITAKAHEIDLALMHSQDTGGIFSEAAARRTVASPLVTSAEAETQFVNDIYQKFLGRDASPAETSTALALLAADGTLTSLRIQLAGSSEYFSRHSATGDTSFVQALYADLLGREPSTSELNRWVNDLTSGVATTNTIAAQIGGTVEAFQHTFDGIIERYLRRTSTPEDLVTYGADIAPATELSLIIDVMDSDEYFARYNTPSTAAHHVSQPTTSYPFVGKLGDAGGDKAGGTLIAPRFVLVAAHSVVGLPPGQLTFTIGGGVYHVKKVYLHPDFTPDAFGTDAANDLAILELDQSVTGITPAQLLDGPPVVGDVLDLVGFGSRNGTDYGTKRLGSTPSIDAVTNSRIVWTFNNPNDTDSTPGDSGSPLFLSKGGTNYVAGVVSGGTDATSALGDVATSTRVDTSLPWIQSIVGPLTNTSTPSVQSITRLAPATRPTNASNVTFTVTFAESVQNVNAADFLTTLGHVGNVTAVTDQIYQVNVEGLGAVQGLLTLSFAGTQDITDLFSNSLANTTPTGTNENTYLIDRVAPASAVAALPPTSGASIPVTWSGADNANGAGLASYDILVSTDGGPFVAWKVGTTATSDTYPGQRGHKYAFFSVATDAAGNREGNATVADASTIVPANAKPPSKEFAVAQGSNSSLVTVYNQNGSVKFTFNPYPNLKGGVRTAMADFTGDGVADLVVGTGPGMSTEVRVLDGASQAELFRVNPFESKFKGGVFVAAGDINGDGRADLVITPDQGGGPRVRIFSGAGFASIADFYAIDDHNFRGGARAAVGDMNNDGYSDLVVAAGFGGGPRVVAYDGKSLSLGAQIKLFNDIYMYEDRLRNGAFVAVGDVDGDGYADIVGGAGPGGAPRVVIASGKSLLDGAGQNFGRIADFYSGDKSTHEGVSVAVKDLDNDGLADVIVGDRQFGQVSAFSGSLLKAGSVNEILSLDDFGFSGGVYVG